MRKTTAVVTGVLLVVSLTGLVILYQKVMELEKENRFIREQKLELEGALSAAQLKIGDLEKDNLGLQGQVANGGLLPVSAFPPDAPVSAALETHIVGVFDGWDGKTVFQMRDGSRWQQDEYSVAYHYATNPRVLLYYKNGGTYMQVEGMNEEVRVRKLGK